jgi:hypothetical protein
MWKTVTLLFLDAIGALQRNRSHDNHARFSNFISFGYAEFAECCRRENPLSFYVDLQKFDAGLVIVKWLRLGLQAMM